MNASSTPRRYSDEQKAEAIDFCLKENLSCAKPAHRLGLHPSILSRWLPGLPGVNYVGGRLSNRRRTPDRIQGPRHHEQPTVGRRLLRSRPAGDR